MGKTYELALVCHVHGDLAAAVAHYSEVLESEKDHAGALLGKGVAQLAMGQDKAARETLLLALESSKIDANDAYFLSQGFLKAGMTLEALRAGHIAHDFEPNSLSVNFALGAAYAGAGLQ